MSISANEYQRTPVLQWLAALVVASGLSVTPAALAEDSGDGLPRCQTLQVPVSLALVPGASLYGELCTPAQGSPSAVQLLVHGATYNRYYSDWPYRPDFYSYVRQAVRAGYATLNIDRLGYGQSTHPPSTLNTVEKGTEALRQVVDKLRRGEIGGRVFSRVIWVGHSLGTVYAWTEASVSRNVDAFVLTGMLHAVKPSWLTLALGSAYPAASDPKFATSGLDNGYLTFRPGTRAPLFYWTPTADPNVIALDERLKDTVSGTEFGAALALFNSPPPATAPSRTIRVPTLLVLGEHDRVFCDEDGLICNQRNVANAEAPYYSSEARVRVLIGQNTGHDLQLHQTAPATGEAILDWLSGELGGED